MPSRIPSHIRDDVRASLHIERSAIHIRPALRGAVTTAGLVTLALAVGHPEAAIPLAMGALFAFLAEGQEILGRRLRVMLWTSVWLGVGTLLGGLASNTVFVGLALSVALAFICGFVGAAGPRAALAGVFSLVVFTIALGNPATPRQALLGALLIMGGALVQTAVTVIAVRQPWELDHPDPIWQRLAHHHSLRDRFVRHGMRLALAIGIATVISDVWTFPHSYWIPMTVAWITRPDSDGTVSRIVGRLVGTVLGLFAVWVIFSVFTMGDAGVVIVVLLAAFLAATFIVANYGLAVVGVTSLVVTLFTLIGDSVQQTAPWRMVATLVATAIIIPIAAFGRAER
jgi:uncharacterized membrane protein YccC